MPLPKRQVLPPKAPKVSKASKEEVSRAKKASEPSTKSAKTSEDSRFANFQSDAKYRLPGKKHSKTQLDDRFSRLLTDPDFYSKASVDKYGRKINKDAGKKELARLYNAGEDESEDEDDEDLDTEQAKKMDKAVRKEMKKVDIRGQGDNELESSSDESSSDEEEDDVEVEDEAELAGNSGEQIPEGEVTNRLAAVNMDWDNIRAKDILAVAESFLPPGGSIKSVVIYPSEFGMERMQREEIEGPPREIFASSSAKNKDNITKIAEESEDEDDQEAKDEEELETGEEFDSKALRQYQLDRLRYYYAILTCSTPDAAKAIYDNLDGREYLSSANFFDLRFVPDDTTFDTDPHDECTRLPDGYKPNEFSTDALTHSKVKLTWDAEDTTRKEAQKRAFSRKEVDDMELQAYIGSDSDSGEEEMQPDKAVALRAALGLGSGDAKSKPKSKSSSSKRDRDFQKPDGEMQVTFSAGLSANAANGSVFENEIPTNETTLEKYIRKQRERKQKRKEKMKATEKGGEVKETTTAPAADDDDPWNDPFFAEGPSADKASASAKKSAKAKKREEKEKEEAAAANKRAELELLMVDDEDARMRHFDMNEIMKAEKNSKKNKKHHKKVAEAAEAAMNEDSFKIDTSDPRFAKLYESHEFAIDPTNPRFKGTKGMKALLEEGRKKRKFDRDDGEGEQKKSKKNKKVEEAADGDDLKKLAARVKAKAKMG